MHISNFIQTADFDMDEESFTHTAREFDDFVKKTDKNQQVILVKMMDYPINRYRCHSKKDRTFI